MDTNGFVNNIFSVTPQKFSQLALEVFRFQYENNEVYKTWVKNLNVDVAGIQMVEQIPFLPVSLFKSAEIKTTAFEAATIFESSGTTETINSQHHVKDLGLYRQSFLNGFQQFYGDVRDWCILGLLPSYLERSNSSLVMMVDELVKRSKHPQSGFYLYNYSELHDVLLELEKRQQPALLIGVTFALLDFAEAFPMQLNYTTVMETGGMKGRREELIRPQVHAILQTQLGINKVHAEYGMTELLSQAYSNGEGIFSSVPWMKVLVRDEDDPLHIKTQGRGVVNVIDLANLYSCSFIATDDAANVYPDGSFKILGRVDNSDVRGCSLMVV